MANISNLVRSIKTKVIVYLFRTHIRERFTFSIVPNKDIMVLSSPSVRFIKDDILCYRIINIHAIVGRINFSCTLTHSLLIRNRRKRRNRRNRRKRRNRRNRRNIRRKRNRRRRRKRRKRRNKSTRRNRRDRRPHVIPPDCTSAA